MDVETHDGERRAAFRRVPRVLSGPDVSGDPDHPGAPNVRGARTGTTERSVAANRRAVRPVRKRQDEPESNREQIRGGFLRPERSRPAVHPSHRYDATYSYQPQPS